jgi:hypothetical protein
MRSGQASAVRTRQRFVPLGCEEDLPRVLDLRRLAELEISHGIGI